MCSRDPTTRDWFVYVLVSGSSRRTYVGVTKNVDRRLEQHNGLRSGGAKATRPWRPWRVGRVRGPFTLSEALKLEYRVKCRRGMRRLDD